MVKDQRGEVKEFEKQAAAAKDPDVKAWAAKSLPVLQQQLKLAEAAQAAVRK
jgi:putative membrane protein